MTTQSVNTSRDSHKPVDPADKIKDGADKQVEKKLEEGLKETFPASDPVSINPGAD
ncbi:MAG: hypothetical protein Q8L66_11885 [Caulobacter sp.]|nr:hypothetical protein [Caulobacter sp.]